MTNPEFDKLPPLLERAVFLEATGLSTGMLAKMVSAGQIHPCRLVPHARKRKYWWAQAAAIRQGQKIPVKPTTFS